MRVGQPGVEGEHGYFDGKAEKEGEKYQILCRETDKDRLRWHLQVMHQLDDIKGELASPVVRIAIEEVQRQNPQEHEHRAKQGVQEELDGRIQAPPMAPDANEEVHRHQHDFPKDVEQEEVQRHEHAQHAGLQKQQTGIVGFLVLLDLRVRTDHNNDREQRRQQHQENANAIYPEEVRHADRRNPVGVFHQLQLVRAGIKIL